ncbi:methenyltetrahydrofolate synthase domain-containing protein isoform X2 [Bombina bombina]|uniref:methenyltetrahydrofolate synthase domain-containing protein isoform X2 n=1 Tax=Bombina bombina TaxID=8345 RepID=UPI00235A65DB|nr:methenyltetrahydrofolate synthase domain-containing protein isoform X2 [Bombina bombina]
MEPTIRLTPGYTKWDIRQKVWDYIENNNLADFPRPVHHRIPNFKGSRQACQNIKTLEVFNQTQEVKVDPDKPLEGVRLEALQAHKTLLVPTPRLRSGLFNKITPPAGATKELLRVCSTSQGVKDYSVPLGLDAKVHVDLVVVGSVAVSEQGWRIGKGEGFADMEYAMMVAMGAVTEHTVVVTVVHDCQVVDFSEELLDDHDLTVDFILTPTRVIKTECMRPKPQGIIWSKISEEMMVKIPILRKLLDKERRAGKDVNLKTSEDSTAESRNEYSCSRVSEKTTEVSSSRKQGLTDRQDTVQEVATVYVGDIPQSTRVSELKGILRERGAAPLRLTWQGAQHRAFLDYQDRCQAEKALNSLAGLSIAGHSVRIEMARTQRLKGNERRGYEDKESGTLINQSKLSDQIGSS